MYKRVYGNAWQGEPFNRPTHVAISPLNLDLYITDGYGNCRVRRFTADGHHMLSWGGPGIDAGGGYRHQTLALSSAGACRYRHMACAPMPLIAVREPNRDV